MKKFLITFGFASFLLFNINNGALAASNTYTVKSGDSLYRIAHTYKISISNLKQWNNLKSDIIHPKQVLKITKPAAVQSVKKASTKVIVSTPAKKTSTKVAKVLTVSASAYTANCSRCSGMTAIGINLKKHPNTKVISVDPKVIKLGTKVYVEGYGYAIAADTGSSIKGNKIDVFIPSQRKALQWGRKTVKVTILK
jgi:3D (Asp-Asp-Asp) domain-containing protein